MQELEKVAILDFGSQYTQLIARRIRELGVFTEIYAPETPVQTIINSSTKGVILSGSPESAHDERFTVDPTLFQIELPLLGICFGMHLMNHHGEGSAQHLGRGEYGKQTIHLQEKSPMFADLEESQVVWMSHGDSIDSLATGYTVVAQSQDGLVAAMQHTTLPRYGLQFHPEVAHTTHGKKILQNFLDLCACEKKWTVKNQIETIKAEIREQVGEAHVVSLVSGGVDSTLSTLLCVEALGADRVHSLHVDTGLMRYKESEQVLKMFENIRFVDASERFFDALKGISEPEEKRKRIGDLFMHILDEEIATMDRDAYFCQGTLYTDLIESGKGVADTIKSHHNVNTPVVQRKREEGLIVEPNALFFKDEVRLLCEELGVPEKMAWRHPFPGPGLAIRIIGEVTPERVEMVRQADRIFLEEIDKAGMYRKIWQAFAVLLPVSSVGVMGDKRTEGEVIALRAVDSSDGMTASCHPLPYQILEATSSRIVNEVVGVNRVVYDVTAKPPGTIEWE